MKNALRLSAAAMMALLIFFASLTHAWQITKPLQDEIKQKQALVKANPDDPFARFDLAITYAYTNRIEEGWSELKKVNDLDPNFKKEALDKYLVLAEAYPNDWRVHYRLAFAYYFNDKKPKAIEELKKVIELDPYNVFAYGYIGLIQGEMDQVDAAIYSVKKGLEIDPQVAALHLLLSQAYYKKGKTWEGFWEGAEAVRLKALGY
ncbi:MAG: tetratricopeptide repeat protein [Candidatus Margulisiibacteriota bacterium]|nr:tetratricopeptide repeat protein [Candidatus Margulisiibacteriota bacterium]